MAKAFDPHEKTDSSVAYSDLACDQEPIHLFGTIQPHGVCLVVDPAVGFIVVGSSRNAPALLLAPQCAIEVIGSSLACILGFHFANTLESRFQSGRLRGEAPWVSTIRLLDETLTLNVAAHTHQGLIFVELEHSGTRDDINAQAAVCELQSIIIDLREMGSDLDALARITARGLRLLTGYERVMVYRFDTDWNGQTIAEDKEDSWEQSFNGVLCPASDIPVQARELYRRTPMRWVADRDALPVPLDFDQAWMRNRPLPHSIDLSFARLRTQSAVHLQIHRYLGIRGSMSLSILYKERLWGLMILHHRQAHYLSPDQELAASILTNAFALRVGPVERTESDEARRKDLAQVSKLLVHMAEASSVSHALTNGEVTIGSLFGSIGAAVLYEGEVSLIGNTPPKPAVKQLAVWLRAQDSEARLFQTNNLDASYAPWRQYAEFASGILAVFLSNDKSDMLLWFRSEEPQSVTWGGSSHLRGSNAISASPVHPYQRWKAMRHGFAKPWAEWEVEMAEALRHDVTEVMVRSLRRIADLNEKLRRSQMVEMASQTQIGVTTRANEILEAKVKARQAQEVVEAKFHFATQARGLGIWKLELETFDFSTSEMCKDNFGRDLHALFTYDDLLNAVLSDDRERMRVAVDRSKLTGVNFEVELPIVRPNGSAGWIQMQAQVVYAENGTSASLVGISLDITERVLTQDRIRQSQKIEAIGRLTAGVAHDFNNVLQALLGGIEIAIDEVTDRPDVCADLELSLQAGQRGIRLTSHLLSFSRQQILRPAALDLSPLLNDLSRTLMRTLGHDILVCVETAANLPYVLADAAHLDAALLNLALNARDSMPMGGKLYLAAHARTDDVVISVTDTGQGMTAEILMHACEPFFTTKGLKGSGLGLSMVQGFARQSGGDLNIRSIPDQGTRVEISLPLARQNALPSRAVKPTPVHGRGRVLVVDDEPDVGRVTAVFLRKTGFEVVLVADANAALCELGSGLLFNALVTDYAMHGMNGADLVLCARELYPLLPAVIITGYAGAEGLGILPSDVTILRKPFQREDLSRTVKRLIESNGILGQGFSEVNRV